MKPLPVIRKYSVIAYAVVLIFVVTGAVFWNSFSILRRFEDTTDTLLLSKAGVAEEVFGILSAEFLDAPDVLQEKVSELAAREPDISAIVVYEREEDGDGFRAVASTDREDIGTIRTELPYLLAWNEDAGSAFLGNEGGTRYWNIVKRIGNDDTRGGLVFFRFSLAENDAFVRDAIVRSYAVTAVTLVFVLILLVHHLRFSRYAVRALDLEDVNRMKDDFISMASHELRSPMTIIRGYADLLGEEPTEEERKEYVGKIATTTERMTELVSDLLDVSRLEQGRLPIDPTDMSLRETLVPLAEDYGKAAKEKGLDFVFEEGDLPTVHADPARVRQILVNLLSNAVKYTAEGSVTVSVATERDRVTITVADTGFGISSEDMGKLFTKFYRVKTDRTAEIQGTGLGLWIAREIARKMGGELGAESIEGVGSHFRLSLKKADS